ncbi:hypothetical protein QFC19_006191 [Naganishia cerealis]|uniref:Uncharacterized protein n=1 Tax=Naganishia cerealis TaxID=610337 RepID=A0ACC2VJ65_9TREE|nr:hypothetical protein QFC19_006191 [Naganishia cerealis]
MTPAPAPIPFPTPPTLKPKPLKTPLPPGIVLDENGKPCKVCNSWQTWAKIAKKQDRAQSHRDGSTGGEGKSGTGGGSTGTKGMAASMFGAAIGAGATAVKPVEKETSESSSLPEPKRPDDCPPDVNALGRATWTFLHTTAAYYPVRATPEQQSSMRSLIQALGTFYPCSWCAADFRERVKVVEPDVSGRAGLSKWFCDRHNEVNENLGKETFNCDMVMERWKDGPPDGRCD